MKIISGRKYEKHIYYTHDFYYLDSPGSGFTFRCDGKGTVDKKNLSDCAAKNYKLCLSGMIDGREIVNQGVQKHTRNYTVPAVGECECGEEVHLRNFTNTCECGIDYNMSGQRLAPREFWGEETGEHWTDCY